MNPSLMLFAAGGKDYAVDLRDVAEVVENASLFPIPLAPPFLAGGINFHGDVVPVADLASLEGGGRSPGGAVVVLDRKAGNLGLRVERIVDMLVRGDSPSEEGVPAAAVAQPGEGTVFLSAAEIIGEIELRLARGGM
jgi:chemotaxis signal transduction protein